MNKVLYHSIKPQGWLKDQLTIQANGLSGHLDEFWPDIRDSGWIGGDCESWERVPYWLDGLIPLAALLDDKVLEEKVSKYIFGILERQCPSGWICPCDEKECASYDTWAVLLICKVFAQYSDFHGDERVEQALYKTMKNLYDLMEKGQVRLFDWGRFRWYEGLVAILHLYRKKPEAWMMKLAHLLREQGADYTRITDLWKRPMNRWAQETHIVNLCMMLKYEALCSELFGEEYTGEAEKLWDILYRYNGTAVDTFTGDECLSGIGNQQGTELCGVIELMYTCEWLYRITQNSIWLDRLEKVAFNALPATFTDDMWAHQYVQMVNQPACVEFPGKSFFRTNSSESHLFGLEPNYGCCTANMHQGWPKLALHAIQQDQGSVIIAHLLPVSAECEVHGTPVKISIDSEYPFKMNAAITVQTAAPCSFDLKIRIPAWVESFDVNGQPMEAENGHCIIRQCWSGNTKLTIRLKTSPKFEERPHGLYVISYGPLIFSLPVQTDYHKKEYCRDNVERKFPYCDYELIPVSEWRYAYADKAVTIHEQNVGSVPFSSLTPPVILKASMSKIHWEWADGYDTVPAAYPKCIVPIDEPVIMNLVPYGCAKLRMTELPMV